MRSLTIAAAGLLLAACATPDHPAYFSTYQIEGATGKFDGKSAEWAHAAAANSMRLDDLAAEFDVPPTFLRAPQPVMPPDDIDGRVVGQVVAHIHFSEAGMVERVAIVRSTKDSLSKAVIKAVSQWRISPPLRNGKPVKLIAQQSFNFETGL